MNDLLYIIIALVIIICGMICYTKGKADGFKEGFDTGERVYHQYKEHTKCDVCTYPDKTNCPLKHVKE